MTDELHGPLRFVQEVDGARATTEFWNIEPIPHPKHDVACPVCKRGTTRFGTVIIRAWNYHARGTRHANKERDKRCDVSFKCTVCSYVWTHGIVVPEAHFKRMADGKRGYHFREGRALLLGQPLPTDPQAAR